MQKTMEFNLSTENQWDSAILITVPYSQWEDWKKYCNKQEMINNHMYGWDFSENEELWLISPNHVKDLYSFLTWWNPAEEFYNKFYK